MTNLEALAVADADAEADLRSAGRRHEDAAEDVADQRLQRQAQVLGVHRVDDAQAVAERLCNSQSDFIEFSGFYPVLICVNGFHWDLTGFIRFYWVSLGFMGVLLGFMGVLLGFIGVILGFTGFCRITLSLLDFTWF